MKENEEDYLQPTSFWKNQSLSILWAHLEEEVNEALVVAIPLCCMNSFGGTSQNMNEVALELADVQIMCNTIIKKIDWGPTLKADDLDTHNQMCGTLAMQIINLVEVKAKAAMDYRAIMRGYEAGGENLYHDLCKLSSAAEALMIWIYDSMENRNKIRQLSYQKNEKRGYYI